MFNKKMKIKPTPQYFIAVSLACLVVAWIVSGVIASIFRPGVDDNARAYVHLVEAINRPYYSEVEEYAREAQRTATDPEIKKLADLIARLANTNIRGGSQTPEQSGSLLGFGKAFVIGFLNPSLGVEGGMLFIETLFTDVEAIGARLDERYQPVFRRYRFASAAGRFVFWMLIVGAVVAYLKYREDHEQDLLRALLPIEFLKLGSSPDKNTRNEPRAGG